MRGSTFITGIFRAYTRTGAEPRSQFGAKTVQIYAPGRMFWSKKGVIIRNAPYTIEAPHLGQIQARINFGEVARRHKGEKGFRDGLPIIAWHIRNEIKDKVWQAIGKLDHKHREVIILRHFRGMSYEKIAEALFCNKGTVTSRLYYARKRLKELLSNEKGGGASGL